MRLTSITRSLSIAGTFAAALALAPAAQAGLVSNGGFETGDLTSWTLSNDAGFNKVCADGGDAFGHTCASHNGGFAFTFGQLSFFGPADLSQDLNTTAGGIYKLKFFVAYDGDDNGSPSNSLSVLWDGGTVYSTTNVPGSGYASVELTGLVASGSTTTLEFDGTNNPTQIFLDDVSVRAPEPATLALFGAGLAGLAARRRRKAKA